MSELIDNDSYESSSMESDSGCEQAVGTKKSAVSKKKAPGGGQNSFANGASALGPQTTALSEHQLQDGSLAGDVQVLILQERKRVSNRLDVVEEHMVKPGVSAVSRKKSKKLSKSTAHDSCTVVKSKKAKLVPLVNHQKMRVKFQI